jgi:hypothetical protein
MIGMNAGASLAEGAMDNAADAMSSSADDVSNSADTMAIPTPPDEDGKCAGANCVPAKAHP